jgi:hypothetical protein
MSTKPPPVPPANQSHKGPGSAEAPKDTGGSAPNNPEKTGQQGNSKINTTHSGHQQDR